MPPSPDSKSAALAIAAFLRALGHDPDTNPDLRATPERVASLYADELLDGYRTDVDTIFVDALESTEQTPTKQLVSKTPSSSSKTFVPTSSAPTTLPSAPDAPPSPTNPIANSSASAPSRRSLTPSATDSSSKKRPDATSPARSSKHLGALGAACVLELRHGCLELHADRTERKRGSRVRTFAFSGAFARPDERARITQALLSKKL